MQSKPPRAMMSGNSRNQWKKRFSIAIAHALCRRISLRGEAVRPISPERRIRNQQRIVFSRLGNIELRNRDGGNLCQLRGIRPIHERTEFLFLCFNLSRRALRQCGEFVPALERALKPVLDGGCQPPLPGVFAVLLVGLAPEGGNLLFVSRHGGKGFVGHALVQFLLPDKADDGVAALDVVVKEVERLAGIVRFKPERDFAQFDGLRIEVDSVDAVPDHVAERGAKGWGRRLLFASAYDGQLVAILRAAASRIWPEPQADIRYTQVEQRGFRFGGFEALCNQVVERVFDERLNEIVRRVVGTRSCSFVALCKVELDAVLPWLMKTGSYSSRPS